MAILKQYDPKKVKLSFGDDDVSEGIAPGTFITVERNVPRNALNVGPDGNGTNVTNNDRSGVVVVTSMGEGVFLVRVRDDAGR